ncbi:lytic murein transglycosylase [Nocardioides sp.]|uniref:lytic murein transglycosylase n=1 Tax=Nocardioides sp. TaxID=35761 RepID=UPI003518DE77
MPETSTSVPTTPARRSRSRLHRAGTLVPLAILSAAWTASLAGASPAAVQTAAPEPTPTLPDGTAVPAAPLEAPASLSQPGSTGQGGTFDGTAEEAAQIVSTSSTNGIPASALAAYQRAETVINAADKGCRLSWQLVAAIGRVESDHGRFGTSSLDAEGVATPPIYGVRLDGSGATASISDTDAGQLDNDTVFDRAVGPMQFIPATWSAVGVDGDNDGARNPQDIDDAALATAVYLCSGSDDLSTLAGQRAAVFRYNHSQAYVDLVLDLMENYEAGDFLAVPDSTRAAGYLTPVVPTDRGDKGKDKGRKDTAQEADVAPAPSEPTTDPEPTDQGGANDPGKDEGKDDGGKDGGKGGSGPLPQVDLPDLPATGVQPVDDVLTLGQALLQCALDGLIDNPLSLTDKFDACVADYTGKK